jgi:hypothetical protein
MTVTVFAIEILINEKPLPGGRVGQNNMGVTVPNS